MSVIVRYTPKPTKKELLKNKLALWAWYLGLKKYED